MNKHYGFRFLVFSNVISAVAFFALASVVPVANAQSLDVPVMEIADGNLDTCAYGKVDGLKADGDGFLAVRSGPGTQYQKLDELRNGDDVWLFNWQGDWIGIVYDNQELNCSPISADREVPYEGKKGWVHKNWIKLLAG
ncbi:MAG: SH3 domain-containing protein [Pseudomonadota bacterium]